MPSTPLVPDVTGMAETRRGFFRRRLDWFLGPDHIHFKLLFGATFGVVVIAALAIVFVVMTFNNQRRDRQRAHTIEVMRLSSGIENDVTALENTFRGQLLTNDGAYLQNFTRLEALFDKHSRELIGVLREDYASQKRILKMRENLQNWFAASSSALLQSQQMTHDSATARPALDSPILHEIHLALQEIQRHEQVELNHRVREQEWAIQSTQILNFVSKMERAAAEMQKEKRGYLLTGDPAFIDSYKRATADFYSFHGYLSVLVASDPGQLEELNRIKELQEAWGANFAQPLIEAKRKSLTMPPEFAARSEAAMNLVRRAMDQFEKEQVEIYQMRSAAAARERILTATGVDLFCLLAALLLIASSSYSFALYRRQLKKLAGADARIHTVVDHVLDGMISINARGAISPMNPAARRMFGFTTNQSFGEDFTGLIPKYFDPQSETPISCDWPSLARHTGKIILAQARTRGRTTFPVELSLTEVVVEQEKFHVAMVRDITERKRFEEQLAAEKNSLAVTLASIGDGVITTDLEGRIVICNKAGEAMTGWPASEAVGRPLRSVFAIAAEATPKRARNGATGFRSEAEAILLSTPERATLTSREGTERIIEQVASPIRDAKNEICGVVVVFRDITERQRDEAERRKGEALDQLGLLAGGIAHDFNNLLTAIIGNISLVSMLLPSDDEMAPRLEDARNASLRARDLAQQLLTFARGGAPIKQAASIRDLIEETVSFSLRGSHNRSEINIEPDLWSAEFDPGQISQVIANLVVNADQAMPDGGTLHVNCDNFSYSAGFESLIADLPPGDYIRIRVRDEGIGIAETNLKRIFDPYFTTKAKGNGLGLATTYSVIKNHSGLITVDSEQHCGSTFTVYLPAAQKTEEPAIVETKPNEPMRGSGRVLIVDDEEAIRMLVDFTLTRLGYEVSAAETALRGIEFYREAMTRGRRFDLVILDLTLPGGMGGKEALKKLLEIDPMVNAVVSSGYAMDATMSRFEDFGFRGMIAKPYEAAELGRKVHAIIESGRQNYAPAYELQHAC